MTAGGGELDAAYERARAVARRIVAGAVSPYEGATTIWKEVVDRLEPPVPDDLWPFKSNASTIEDCRWNAAEGGASHDELARISHRLVKRSAGGAGDGGVFDPTGAESGSAARRAPGGERTPPAPVHRALQPRGGEICGLVARCEAEILAAAGRLAGPGPGDRPAPERTAPEPEAETGESAVGRPTGWPADPSARARIAGPPPAFFLGALVAGSLLERIHPLPAIGWAGPPQIAMAGVLAGTSFALAGLAFRVLRRHRTPVDPYRPTACIVSQGPYRLTRNPLYVALLLLFLAFAVLMDSVWMFVLTPVLWAVLHIGVVRREEAYLSGRFGASYARYRARVNRWWPFPRR